MKYEFVKVDDDITKLKYKDKEFEIKKDVSLMKKMQSIPVIAKTKMMVDLSKQGITTKDLVVVSKDKDKTFYDNSNIQELEEAYYNQASVDIIDELCTKCFGLGLVELIQDIDLNEKEMEIFSQELIIAFSGIKKEAFPSTK